MDVDEDYESEQDDEFFEPPTDPTDEEDSSPHTPPTRPLPSPPKKSSKSKRKAKGKSRSSAKSARTSKYSSRAALTGSAGDSAADLNTSGLSHDSGDKQNLGKKQKELPKPTIPITMHHPFLFKNPDYLRKKAGYDEEKSPFRLLKYIVAQEKAEWDDIPSHPSYWTIKAPPRLKPAKKYSDISGFEALYTDPETKLHYADSEEFEICRSLTRDLQQSYLRLRGFVDIIG